MIVLGEDFHQVLSVISEARREEILNASLGMSYLWPLFIKIKLT